MTNAFSFLNDCVEKNSYKTLDNEQLIQLATELRVYLIDHISKFGGHFAANLGVVELTVALFHTLNLPKDKLVWDVGHQAYAHKILSGRLKDFHTNRTFGGISGFPKMSESEYDAFGTAHSSTSISAILGMAVVAHKTKDNRDFVAVIGDGALGAGQAFEALNHAGFLKSNILVILNDNSISIDKNVGALNEHLYQLKNEKSAQNTFFNSLEIAYSGPIDGHNISLLTENISALLIQNGPKILHVITKKGKGFTPAEEDQIKWHSTEKFDKLSGTKIQSFNKKLGPKYQDVFGETLCELGRTNSKIMAITPAMPTGSSVLPFMNEFPDRAFDTGISEQHAVTFSAGIAAAGNIAFCAIYSTFLQRGFDQLIHDVALQNLPVIFCIDRAGIVGEDGPTHHGIFDISYLNCIPNMVICAPENEISLRNLMYSATLWNKPTAIRYPRGNGNNKDWKQPFQEIEIGKNTIIKNGNTVAILAVGTTLENALLADEILQKSNINASIVSIRFIKPFDEKMMLELAENHSLIITVEDGSVIGGFGSIVSQIITKNNLQLQLISLGCKDGFVPQGSIEQLQDLEGYSPDKIAQSILKSLET